MEFAVLECRAFRWRTDRGYRPVYRRVKDFEIDLELSSGREYSIDGEKHTLRRGDMCVRFPGQEIVSVGEQNSLLLTLDFSGQTDPLGYSRNTGGIPQPPVIHPLAEALDNVIRFDDFTPIQGLYQQLLDCVDHTDMPAQLMVRRLLHLANAQVCRRRLEEQTRTDTPAETALRYMREHLHEEITLETLAGTVFLEKSYFCRVFRRRFGRSPIDMLIGMRLEKARELVLCTDMRIGEIAGVCGYRSASYFSGEYRKMYGLTPEAHRNGEK